MSAEWERESKALLTPVTLCAILVAVVVAMHLCFSHLEKRKHRGLRRVADRYGIELTTKRD